ncbi:MAG: FeoA family protein [Proteobacteria bacterium]|nr:FeoA family protein [Pseudomonadota bacterium]
MKLADIEIGSTAIVKSVADGVSGSAAEAMSRRLMELGFLPGCQVEVVHEAPFSKNPRSYLIRGMHIALRNAEANLIEVDFNGSKSV